MFVINSGSLYVAGHIWYEHFLEQSLAGELHLRRFGCLSQLMNRRHFCLTQ